MREDNRRLFLKSILSPFMLKILVFANSFGQRTISLTFDFYYYQVTDNVYDHMYDRIYNIVPCEGNGYFEN